MLAAALDGGVIERLDRALLHNLPAAESPPLDAGRPHRRYIKAALERVGMERLFPGNRIEDRQLADCVASALYLQHDFFDESHRVSQKIETPTGSFYHGIMSRREGDFSNAEYWFRHVDEHPVFHSLQQQVSQAAKMLSHRIVSDFISQIDTDQKWMPDLFVNVVARVVETDTNNCPEKTAAKNIQRLESDLLLDYIHRCATA